MAIVPIEVATDGFMGTGNKPLSIAVRGLLIAGIVEAIGVLLQPLFGPLFEPLRGHCRSVV